MSECVKCHRRFPSLHCQTHVHADGWISVGYGGAFEDSSIALYRVRLRDSPTSAFKDELTSWLLPDLIRFCYQYWNDSERHLPSGYPYCEDCLHTGMTHILQRHLPCLDCMTFKPDDDCTFNAMLGYGSQCSACRESKHFASLST